MDLFMGGLPEHALGLLQGLSEEKFEQRLVPKGVSKKRWMLMFEVITDKVRVETYHKMDIQRYALKVLFEETYNTLHLTDHPYSASESYSYDPAKNGQNIIKHGFGFDEILSYSSEFGTLMVPCPDDNDGTRCVIFSNMDAGVNGENLDLPFPGITGKIATLSVAQQRAGGFRFISSMRLSRKSYFRTMMGSFKNIYDDDPTAKDCFVKRCAEIVERDLFK